MKHSDLIILGDDIIYLRNDCNWDWIFTTRELQNFPLMEDLMVRVRVRYREKEIYLRRARSRIRNRERYADTRCRYWSRYLRIKDGVGGLARV